jgi:hypothetical protein
MSYTLDSNLLLLIVEDLLGWEFIKYIILYRSPRRRRLKYIHFVKNLLHTSPAKLTS